jgi:glyoxylase-like metal-dependent hydrolase (beta-lactamase superfamily II)
VSDRLSLLEGADRIDVYYFGRGHTDGDLVVVFPQKRLAHLGDLFPGKAAPSIDTANGGSAVELPRTLARIVAELKDVVRVTTGHDDSTIVTGGRQDSGAAIFANPRTMTWRDVQEYADFNSDFLAAVKQAITEGKTAADAFDTLRLPDRYKGYDMREARANVEAIYRELGK